MIFIARMIGVNRIWIVGICWLNNKIQRYPRWWRRRWRWLLCFRGKLRQSSWCLKLQLMVQRICYQHKWRKWTTSTLNKWTLNMFSTGLEPIQWDDIPHKLFHDHYYSTRPWALSFCGSWPILPPSTPSNSTPVREMQRHANLTWAF